MLFKRPKLIPSGPHYLQNSRNSPALILSPSAGGVKDALEFRASGKGGFAFDKEFKIPLGTEGVLRRNSTNVHGEFMIQHLLLLREGDTDIIFPPSIRC